MPLHVVAPEVTTCSDCGHASWSLHVVTLYATMQAARVRATTGPSRAVGLRTERAQVAPWEPSYTRRETSSPLHARASYNRSFTLDKFPLVCRKKPNAIWTSYKNGPLYHGMISLLLFFVTSKVLAGKALQRTPYPQPSRYRYREHDIYTHLLCPNHPAKLWISQPPWRTGQIEHLMISIPLSSRDPWGCAGLDRAP